MRIRIDFGANVRRERTARRITQEKLAELTDLNSRIVQKIESGELSVRCETLRFSDRGKSGRERLVHQGGSKGETRKTGPAGHVSFRLSKDGRWLFRGTDIRESNQSDTNSESDFTTLR